MKIQGDVFFFNYESQELYVRDWFKVKGILWDFFIFILEQNIVLNKNCT